MKSMEATGVCLTKMQKMSKNMRDQYDYYNQKPDRSKQNLNGGISDARVHEQHHREGSQILHGTFHLGRITKRH
jgi:hypothetical protein